MTLRFHPLADVLPLIEGDAFNDLVASIKESGLLDPIVIYEDAILDGRNRYRACLQAGVEPRTENFNGGDPVKFVLDHNLCRRHLTPSQKAMAMEKYATLSPGQKGLQTHFTQTRADIAKLAGVSVSSIKRAKVVRRQGTPEEIASVVNGKVALSTLSKRIKKRCGNVVVVRAPRPPRPPRRLRGGMTQKKTFKVFHRALSLFCNYAENLEEIPLPHMADFERKEAGARIKEATRLIKNFRRRVAGINGENK